MMTEPRAESLDVHRALEALSVAGGPLHVTGPRASVNVYDLAQLARRTVDVVREYEATATAISIDRKRAVVTSGPPAAGKSTLLDAEGFLRDGYRNIDSDLVKDMLLERSRLEHIYDDLLERVLPDGKPIMLRELSGLVHMESVAIADKLHRRALARGEDVIIQGTLGWAEQPSRLLQSLYDADYQELIIVHVDQPLHVCAERAIERWWLDRAVDSSPLGGRFVAHTSLARLYDEDDHVSVCGPNARLMYELSSIDTTLIEQRDGERFSRQKTSLSDPFDRVEESDR